MNGNRCEPEMEIKRSSRKTVSIEVKSDKIVVRAPNCMSAGEIHAFVDRKKAWIGRHWQKMRERQERLGSLSPYTEEELNALAEKARRVLPEKVKYYAPLVGVDYGRVTVRSQRSRWGSCSAKGNLNFNCLMMLLPEDVADSIVVHELCHRKHMNHSPRFYAEVERVFPGYKRCEGWLNENGTVYLGRLPRK